MRELSSLIIDAGVLAELASVTVSHEDVDIHLKALVQLYRLLYEILLAFQLQTYAVGFVLAL